LINIKLQMQKIITYRLDCCLQHLYRELYKEIILIFIRILICKQI